MLKNRSILYFLLTFLYVIGIMSAISYFSLDRVWSIILFLVCLVIFEPVYQQIVNLIHYCFLCRIMNIYNEKCDPVTYLSEYNKYYDLLPNSKLISIHALYKSIALMALGKITEAEAMINKVNLEEFKINSLIQSYYIILAAIAIEQNNMVVAESYLHKAEEYHDKENLFNRRFLRMTKCVIEINHAELLKTQGNLLESKKMLESVCQTKLSKATKISGLYSLGLIELEMKNNKKAKEYLTIVAQEGNKLFIAHDARQKLVDLESSRVDPV